MRYFLAPRSGEKSYKNFQSSIVHGVPFRRIEPFLGEQGKRILSEQEIIYAWGNRQGNTNDWEKMEIGDTVIFYAHKFFVMAGTVLYKERNADLALSMWPPDEKGKPWENTFFLHNLKYFKIPLEYFNYISGYKFKAVMGFQEITEPHVRIITTKYHPVEKLFDDFYDSNSLELPKVSEITHVNISKSVNTTFITDFSLQEFEESTPLKTSSNKKSGYVDFEVKNKRNKLVGDRGEEIVVQNQIDYLKSVGRVDLANKVERIALENTSAGYDILSYDKHGNEMKIEVKSTSQKYAHHISFNVSANELEVANGSENYYVFLVFAANTDKPEIRSLKNPFKSGKLNLTPTSYRVVGVGN